MDNLIFSINAVMPIFLVILIGYGIKRLGYLDEKLAKKMNAIVFNFAMPVMLFRDMIGADLKAVMDLDFIIFALAATIISCAVAWIAALVFVRDRRQIGAFVQGSFRGNYVFIGLPLAANIMGGTVPPIALAVTTFVVPAYNVFAVIILTIYSGEKMSVKETALVSIKNIAKNPLIWGIFAGAIFSLSGLTLPGALKVTCDYMASLASPTALLCIGGTLSFGKIGNTLKPALGVCALKLIASPLVFVSLAIFRGMPRESIVVLYIMLATPTSISSYTMASMMNSDEQLASNIVVMTSLLSIFTFTVGIFLLKSGGII